MQPTRSDLDICLHVVGRRLLAATGGGPPGCSDRADPLSDAPPGIGLQVVGAHGSATSSVQGWRVEQDGPYDELCAQAALG